MAQHTRNSRRLKLPSDTADSGPSPRDRRLRIGVAAGAVVVLLAVIVVAALSLTNAFGAGGSKTPVPGLQIFAENDHSHVTGTVSYDRVPPAGGAHNATPLNCGVYSQPVPNENAVHSLEHGAVWITYQPTLSADQIALLQQLVTSSYVGSERYLILSPYAGIPSPIVATAWGIQLDIPQASDPRLADFMHQYAGGGQGGEPGGPCTGGVGTPVE